MELEQEEIHKIRNLKQTISQQGLKQSFSVGIIFGLGKSNLN